MRFLTALFKKNKKDYVSALDIFLQEFDQTNKHKKTESQQAEIKEYNVIFKKRDHKDPFAS